MKFAIILLSFLVATAYTNHVNPGFFLNKETRIHHGEVAIPGQFPWQVGIKIMFDEENGAMCGGALINRNCVLTAAHCMPEGIVGFELRFGSINFSKGGVVRKSTRYLKHENFHPTWLYNDVGVIFFEDPVPITNEINIISFPFAEDVLTQKDRVIATGYGATEAGYNEVLKYIEVLTIFNEKCKLNFPFIKEDQVCCIGTDGKNTCKGDSGGPLVKLTDRGYVHVGISSFVDRAGCDSNRPFGFARTEKHMRWIFDAVDKLQNGL